MRDFKGKITVLFFFLMVLSGLLAQNKLDRITVNMNNFVTEDGKILVFRGLNTSDPDKLESQGHWTKSYFEEIKNWGANIVRLPVHPPAWTKRGKEGYLKLLDEAIEWATELNLYVIIDWHSIGNLRTEMYQNDIYDTTLKQTYDFWRTIAVRYGKNTTVAFYELFNQPATFNRTLGTLTWDDWKAINEELITIIRANGGEGIPDRFWEDKAHGWLDDSDVRVFVYWTIISGAAVYTYGCNDIWQMYDINRAPLLSARTDWQAALQLPGSSQMTYMRQIFEKLHWQNMKLNQNLILNNNPENQSYILSAIDSESKFVIAYTPIGNAIKIDLSKIDSRKINAYWFNPRSGKTKLIGVFETNTPQEFKPWSSGWGSDFLLLLTAENYKIDFKDLKE